MRHSPVLAIAIVLLGLAGCKADPPGKFETRTATFVKHDIFIRNKGQTNPLPSNANTWADGKEAFSHYCVACHGMDGQNTGVPFADHISPPIPFIDLQGRSELLRRAAQMDIGQWDQSVRHARLKGNTER